MDLIGVRFLLAQRIIHRETETMAGGEASLMPLASNFYVVVISMVSQDYIQKKRKSWVISSFKVAGSRIELETSGL